MIDLSKSSFASPQIHCLPSDPGQRWSKDQAVAIEAAPDDDPDPLPETTWASHASRTGRCGAVGPRVVALSNGGFRMYYTQVLPRSGFPAGCNDYDNSTARILSAFSKDGESWTPEPGVRLSPQAAGAGDYRVVSSEVVPIGDGRRLRMFFECCTGPQSTTNSIRSAISTDGGLAWMPESGVRIQTEGHNYSSPRILFLSDGRCRMYYYDRGRGIVSAVSEDGGLVFTPEPGVRISQDGPHDSHAAFACEIFTVTGIRGYVMYYAGYSQPNRAQILRATSADGLIWRKDTQPVISPGSERWDFAKCSEMCVIRLPLNADKARYRLLYEACDGTAVNERGVWRIASATSCP